MDELIKQLLALDTPGLQRKKALNRFYMLLCLSLVGPSKVEISKVSGLSYHTVIAYFKDQYLQDALEEAAAINFENSSKVSLRQERFPPLPEETVLKLSDAINQLAENHINRTKKTLWFRRLETSDKLEDKREALKVIERIKNLYN